MKWQAVDILGEDRNRHDRIWFVYWRPQIEYLMSGSEKNYIAGLMLMIPCMERAYTLKHPERDVNARENAQHLPFKDVLKWFFKNENPEGYDRIIYVVAQGFANGLKHDSFVRDEICLYDKNVAWVQSGNTGNTGNTIDSALFSQRRQAIVEMVDGRVAIAPRSFWSVVSSRIDKFYLEEYPIPSPRPASVP